MVLILKSSISILLLILFFPALQASRQEENVRSSPEQIQEEFSKVPCKNEERLNSAKVLFERTGAPPAELSIKKYKS